MSQEEQGPSSLKTFVQSEGGGMLASFAGAALGGRYLSKSKGFRKMVAGKRFQSIGSKIFGTHVAPGTKAELRAMNPAQRAVHRQAYKDSKQNGVTAIHAGSELGAHVVGGAVSYAAIKHNLEGHKKSDNKYLQKAASLSEHLH